MENFNNIVKVSVTRTEQLKNRARAQQCRKVAAAKKADARRCYLVGEMVCRYFPDVRDSTITSDHLEAILGWLVENRFVVEELMYDR